MPESISRRIVRLRTEHTQEEVDLEARADQPIAELMPNILKVLGWPETQRGQQIQYALITESGEAIAAGMSLEEAGVENSDVLWIRMNEEQPNGRQPSEVSADAPRSAGGRGSPAPPVEASIELETSSLVSERGIVFDIGEPPIIVGRSSRDFTPDIDLTDLDPEYASSRAHSRLEHDKDGRLTLIGLTTTNGTFVNGSELTAGDGHRLVSGDQITFGFEGVRMTYFAAGDSIPSSFFS